MTPPASLPSSAESSQSDTSQQEHVEPGRWRRFSTGLRRLSLANLKRKLSSRTLNPPSLDDTPSHLYSLQGAIATQLDLSAGHEHQVESDVEWDVEQADLSAGHEVQAESDAEQSPIFSSTASSLTSHEELTLQQNAELSMQQQNARLSAKCSDKRPMFEDVDIMPGVAEWPGEAPALPATSSSATLESSTIRLRSGSIGVAKHNGSFTRPRSATASAVMGTAGTTLQNVFAPTEVLSSALLRASAVPAYVARETSASPSRTTPADATSPAAVAGTTASTAVAQAGLDQSTEEFVTSLPSSDFANNVAPSLLPSGQSSAVETPSMTPASGPDHTLAILSRAAGHIKAPYSMLLTLDTIMAVPTSTDRKYCVGHYEGDANLVLRRSWPSVPPAETIDERGFKLVRTVVRSSPKKETASSDSTYILALEYTLIRGDTAARLTWSRGNGTLTEADVARIDRDFERSGMLYCRGPDHKSGRAWKRKAVEARKSAKRWLRRQEPEEPMRYSLYTDNAQSNL